MTATVPPIAGVNIVNMEGTRSEYRIRHGGRAGPRRCRLDRIQGAGSAAPAADRLLTVSLRSTLGSIARLRVNRTERATTLRVVAGNKGENGIFAPIVRVTRDAMGTKEFNQFRGKAISLHSQIIKDFCKEIGVQSKQAQGLIRLAKKNGECLGFLA